MRKKGSVRAESVLERGGSWRQGVKNCALGPNNPSVEETIGG